MCGRYQFTAEQSAEIQQIIQEVQERVDRKIKTGEIYPTDQAPVLRNTADGIKPDLLTWGVPLKGKPVINARVETVVEKPLFRGSVQQRRCVIPSSGFFEWDERKQKYLFRLFGEDTLYMAGIYQEQEGAEHYCILTTAANNSMALASSYLDQPVPDNLVSIGEVGLTGELRSVNQLEQRLKEVRRVGFQRCLIPAQRVAQPEIAGLELIPVQNIGEALRVVLRNRAGGQ